MARTLDCRDPAAALVCVAAVAAELRRGGAAVVPGESGYLLVGDAFSVPGVAAVRAAKDRPGSPLSVLVGDVGTVDGLATEVPDFARALMEAFWPGGLTLVLPQQPNLTWPLAAFAIAVRIPSHQIPLGLARELGPTASSSANRAGFPVARSVAEAREQFEDEVSIFLDAGEPGAGERSTIVDATTREPRLIRAGEVGLADLRRVCPEME